MSAKDEPEVRILVQNPISTNLREKGKGMQILNSRNHSYSSPNLSRGFFIALLITLSFPFRLIAAQPAALYQPHLQGQIVEADGSPVPYVSISFQQAGFILLTDETGYYSCDLPPLASDSVRIQRIGYKTRFLPLEEFRMLDLIQLESAAISMADVKIEARKASGHNPVSKPMTDFISNKSTTSLGPAVMLERIPGIVLKTYGGPAGISTLSLDGGPSSHTKLVLNGIDVTSSQNGETDLSQLPLPLIQRLQYIPFDISRGTSGASDGTVKLESGNLPNLVEFSSGSFGHAALSANLSQRFASSWVSLQLGSRYEAGNYPVVWNGTTFNRRNNTLNQNFAAFRLVTLINERLFLQLSAMESRQNRGVAGLLWSPDTLSHRDDRLRLLGILLGFNRADGSTRMLLGQRYSEEDYENPYLYLSSHHELSGVQLRISDKRELSGHFTLLSELELFHNGIRSNTTQDHRRNRATLSISPVFSLPLNIELIPAYKQYYSPGLFNSSTTNLQVNIPFQIGLSLNAGLNYAENFRYPSFNDLYWQPGGNPDLQAEETVVRTGQLRVDAGPVGQIMLQYQDKYSNNLIQWLPVHTYWQPGNIQKSRRQSRKLSWKLNRQDLNLQAFAHLSLI